MKGKVDYQLPSNHRVIDLSNDTIRIITIGDTHSAAEPMIHLLATILEEIKNSPLLIPTVLVILGDVFAKNTWLATFRGEADIAIYERFIAEIDPELTLFVPGSHDYSFGEDAIAKFVQSVKAIPLLSNASFKEESALGKLISPSATLRFPNGHCIFCWAAVTKEAEYDPLHKYFYVQTREETRQTVVNLFERYEPTTAWGLTHTGSEYDIWLQEKLRGTPNQFIFGSHSHDDIASIQPIINGKQVSNCSAGLGYVSMRYVSMPNQASTSYHCSFQKSNIQLTHPVLEGIIADYRERHRVTLNYDPKNVLFTYSSETPLPKCKTPNDYARVADTAFSRFTTDAIRDSFQEQKQKIHFCFVAAADLRQLASEDELEKPLTEERVANNYFNNTYVIVFQATGQAIIEALTRGIIETNYYAAAGRVALLHPSQGFKYCYDLTEVQRLADQLEQEREGAERIELETALNQALGRIITHASYNGKLLRQDEAYTIGVTDWLFMTLQLFPEALQSESFKAYRKKPLYDYVAEYLRPMGKPRLDECFAERIIPTPSFETQITLSNEKLPRLRIEGDSKKKIRIAFPKTDSQAISETVEQPTGCLLNRFFMGYIGMKTSKLLTEKSSILDVAPIKDSPSVIIVEPNGNNNKQNSTANSQLAKSPLSFLSNRDRDLDIKDQSKLQEASSSNLSAIQYSESDIKNIIKI